MGRYAFFSTGVEYKFWFAVQPTSDILKFGGHRLYARDSESLHHVWNSANTVWKRILDLSRVNEVLLKQWISQFPATVNGTEQLIADIDGSHFGSDAAIVLGLIIWHQLLYTPRLYAEYEG